MAQGLFTLRQVNQAIRQSAWSAYNAPQWVEYLVVAGGGGGGGASGSSGQGGGGGAGGLLTGMVPVVAGTSYTVTVGAGGSGSASSGIGGTGVSSVFGSISTSGGGGGGTYSTKAGVSGGSGGGSGGDSASSSTAFGGQGTFNQGNAGGNTPLGGVCGGGGGAGTVGLSSTGTYSSAGYGGNGGAGIASSISGTVTTYAGGGGGSSNNVAGTGGVGGGGAGGVTTAAGTAGTANTGGGGGGHFNANTVAGAGGSGIVIVSYPDVYAAPTATTGSPTVSTSGSGSVNFATAGYFSTGTGTAPSQSGDFTLEGWFNLSTFNPGGGGYALFGGTTSGANYFGIKGTNIVINSATTSAEKLIACTLPSTNTWFHYCLMRSGSTLYAFLNGVLQGSSTWTDVLFSAGSLLVGGYGSATYICPGYMSNLRLTNTAVYSTSGFTVPTSPLTRVTGTALLMNTVSGAYAADSTGTWSFLNLYTAPTWNALSPFTGTGYKNRVYTWTSSGSITF